MPGIGTVHAAPPHGGNGHRLSRSVREGVGSVIVGGAAERSTGETMYRNHLIAFLGLVAGLTAALSAQAPSPRGKADQKTIPSISVTVIGCVVGGSEACHYRLTHAVLSGDDIPSTAATAGRLGSGEDISFE